jgi:hypothetical protein
MPGANRWLVVIPALALLAFLSFWGVRWAWGDVYATTALRQITKWDAEKSPPALETFLWVRRALERAQVLAPADPAIPELLGLMHLQQSDRPEFSELALEHFGRALALRPSSPYTWANVAEAKFRLGQTQAPFEEILLRAQALGPSEPETQRMMVELGSALWNELSAPAQREVKLALERAMRRNPLETLLISERRGRLDLACPLAAGEIRLEKSKWPKVCEELEAGA